MGVGTTNTYYYAKNIKEGKIIAKNLKGAELDQKLEEVLGH
jgi:hypothetical protein